jgi:hypothetical protein
VEIQCREKTFDHMGRRWAGGEKKTYRSRGTPKAEPMATLNNTRGPPAINMGGLKTLGDPPHISH